MTIYGWDAVPSKIRMPKAGQTVNSAPFTVPKGARAVSIHCPALVGSATYNIQSLTPAGDDQATEAWLDINVFSPGAGITPVGQTVPSNSMTVFNTRDLGGGVLRLVASADQSGTPVDIPMQWHMEE